MPPHRVGAAADRHDRPSGSELFAQYRPQSRGDLPSGWTRSPGDLSAAGPPVRDQQLTRSSKSCLSEEVQHSSSSCQVSETVSDNLLPTWLEVEPTGTGRPRLTWVLGLIDRDSACQVGYP